MKDLTYTSVLVTVAVYAVTYAIAGWWGVLGSAFCILMSNQVMKLAEVKSE